MDIALVALLLISLILAIVGFVKPTAFQRIFKSRTKKSLVGGSFAVLSLLIFVAIGVLNLGASNNSKVLTKPSTSQDVIYGQMFEGALADTSIKYAEAQVYSDAWLRANPSEMSYDDWLKLGQTVKDKWKTAQAASQNFDAVAAAIPNYAEPKLSDSGSWLVSKAYALDPAYKEFYKHREDIKKDQEYMDKLKAVDVAPAGQRIKTAAKLFNTDITHAKAIVDNFYNQWSTNAASYAGMADSGSKAATAIATGSNIALFVGGLYTGASELALLGSAQKLANAVNIITTSFAGANLVLDVGSSGADLGLFSKETGAAFTKAKDAAFLKVANTLISIKDLGKALSNFAKIKESMSGKDGKLSFDSIKKFMAKGDEVKKVADNLKENGVGNMQTLYDWTSWAGDKTTDIAKLFQEPGPSTIGLNTTDPSQINQTLPMVKLDANGIPIALIAQNVPGLFTPYTAPASSTPTPAAQTPAQEIPKPSYDGTYSGSGSAATGIASASVDVSGSSMSGSGSYRQSVEGTSFYMSISISGTVSEDGHVSGRVSASGSLEGKSYSASGSIKGSISEGRMALSYSVSGSAGSASGNISLYK
ncbi:hypothetical protein HYW35_02900 [Candidatus Saccharibacteria bacterium]|nr:hypothetical protein [Candidatus Saccharibacteria bacterium]